MARKPPSLVLCFGCIALMDLVPRVLGMRRALALARRLAGDRADAADSTVLDETARRVATAAAFYPRRALCLEQSLALYMLLRRRGIPAVLKLGVQTRPFYAHAWVESCGRPVNESGDLPARLATFPALGV